MIVHAGHEIDIYGVDISEENIKLAKQRLENAHFFKVTAEDSLNHLGQFDLIICNFVLVENKNSDMTNILKNIHSLLSNSGIAIITNCTSKAYKPSNKWYTFNNKFSENSPSEWKKNKLKFKEDQAIKVQVFASYGSNLSFTFYDFFHSGTAYRRSYEAAQLDLIETHKPIGKESDGIQWESERVHSPYKIHILSKRNQLIIEKENISLFSKL